MSPVLSHLSDPHLSKLYPPKAVLLTLPSSSKGWGAGRAPPGITFTLVLVGQPEACGTPTLVANLEVLAQVGAAAVVVCTLVCI